MTMLTDAILVDRVVAGFEGDFEELYKRHAGTAWRVAQAVTGDAHDAADAVAEAFARVFQAVRSGRLTDASAFRSYLLTATRNASLDQLRRGGRTRPTDNDDLDLIELSEPTPGDMIEGAGDAAMISEAFRNLPERWRSVLWLTEVEGVATKDVADQLGISANGAAQLAVRARAGLRERFLQAHLKGTTEPDCRFTVDRLGAYVGGGLAPRDLAKVDQHLAGCATCREKKEELEDLGSSLRRIILPLPLLLGAVAGKRVAATLIAAHHPIAVGPTVGAKVVAATKKPAVQRALAGAAAGVFGLGLLAASMSGGIRPSVADLSSPAGASEAATANPVDLPSAVDLSGLDAALASSGFAPTRTAPNAFELARSDGGAPATLGSAPAALAATGPAPTTKPKADDGAGGSPLPLPLPGGGGSAGDEPIVAANVGGTGSGQSVGATVSVGTTPEVGVQVGDTVVGTAPDVPESDGVTATVDPIGADPITVSLP
ncbi:MAG: large repetitive protein [Actinomycetota bacterium]|jgi:RNA polymerase sigma factor (sigma-70 family)